MNKWRDCKTDPSPMGKKVLCRSGGDFFVGQRFRDFYLPIPFVDHPLAEPLVKPDEWQDIDFPPPYTGYLLIKLEEDDFLMTMDELRQKHPEEFEALVDVYIQSVGKMLNWDHLASTQKKSTEDS